jgi:hypothetical protein
MASASASTRRCSMSSIVSHSEKRRNCRLRSLERAQLVNCLRHAARFLCGKSKDAQLPTQEATAQFRNVKGYNNDEFTAYLQAHPAQSGPLEGIPFGLSLSGRSMRAAISMPSNGESIAIIAACAGSGKANRMRSVDWSTARAGWTRRAGCLTTTKWRRTTMNLGIALASTSSFRANMSQSAMRRARCILSVWRRFSLRLNVCAPARSTNNESEADRQ